MGVTAVTTHHGGCMRRVVFNQKGGVGKSSVTANLAAISAYQGIRTLVVDLDPQSNASHYLLGRETEIGDISIAGFFKEALSFRLKPSDPEDFVWTTAYDNLFLLPATPELSELQNKLEAKHKIFKLRDALRTLQAEYDAVYIDTPPALNFYTLSALIAAHGCLIPFDCDDFSRHALYTLMENVEETRADLNCDLRVEGIIVNQFMAQANLPARMVEELRQEQLPLFHTKLSASVKMRESHEQSMPLIYLAPKHKLTREFILLFQEMNESSGLRWLSDLGSHSEAILN
jgi:chromosome partitioning protein